MDEDLSCKEIEKRVGLCTIIKGNFIYQWLKPVVEVIKKLYYILILIELINNNFLII